MCLLFCFKARPVPAMREEAAERLGIIVSVAMTKVLVVDDEQDLCDILRFDLESEGYEVTTCGDAEGALALLTEPTEPQFDLILLDVMMDKMSGFELASRLRAAGDNTPVIFLTARDSHDDQLKGFECGADDYITKPFSFDTVLARVRAVLKRTAAPAAKTATQATQDDGKICCGGVVIDPGRQSVTAAGRGVELTRREYGILCLMAENPNIYFTREEIMTRVWPEDALVNDRSVDVHIARLRKKLGSEGRRIVNRTGFGYTMQA